MIEAVGRYTVIEPKFEKKKGLIFIPDQSQKQSSEYFGIVRSVGPECPHDIKPGDKVLYIRNEGQNVESGQKKLLIIKPEWILAVMEDE